MLPLKDRMPAPDEPDVKEISDFEVVYLLLIRGLPADWPETHTMLAIRVDELDGSLSCAPVDPAWFR